MGLDRPRGERRYPTVFDQQKELTELRWALPWLADVPRDVCAQLLLDLDKAWQRCFKKLARAPRWKRKGVDALGFCENHPKMWRMDDRHVWFPKLGIVRTVAHRALEGRPKTCTIVRDGDQWFVSIVCEIDQLDTVVRSAPIVALDRGVVSIVADSDGRIVPNPRHLEPTMRRLALAQRAVSRKKKGSKNREKAKVRVARLHRKVRRQRAHTTHSLSAGYAKSHGIVVVEKLQIGNMVKGNRGLARSILGAGWGMLVEQLRYKLAWSGGTLVEVPAAYSSQTCSACGCVDAESRLGISFCCTSCGYRGHADINAAKVLLTRANRSGKPGDGILPEGTGRTRKRVRLRGSRSRIEGQAR